MTPTSISGRLDPLDGYARFKPPAVGTYRITRRDLTDGTVMRFTDILKPELGAEVMCPCNRERFFAQDIIDGASAEGRLLEGTARPGHDLRPLPLKLTDIGYLCPRDDCTLKHRFDVTVEQIAE